jgi:hypothetical protein
MILMVVTTPFLLAADEKKMSLRFNKGDVGRGWKAEKTGKGEGSVWQVVQDESAPSKTGYVLAQLAESPGAVFNLCVAQDTSLKDGERLFQGGARQKGPGWRRRLALPRPR